MGSVQDAFGSKIFSPMLSTRSRIGTRRKIVDHSIVLLFLRGTSTDAPATPLVLVVNLDRSPERWESAQERMLACRRFSI